MLLNSFIHYIGEYTTIVTTFLLRYKNITIHSSYLLRYMNFNIEELIERVLV